MAGASMASVSAGSTFLTGSPLLDTVSADLTCIHDHKVVALLVAQRLYELILSPPNYCPPMVDPIFSPSLDIISADLSYDNKCGSKDSHYGTLQDDNKVSSSNFREQELNDSMTSAEQLDAAATFGESVSNDIVLFNTPESACLSGEDDNVQGTVCEDEFESPDEENLQLPVFLRKVKFWIGTLVTRTKQALITWPGSVLSRLTGIESYLISAVVVLTAYGQLLLINMSYLNISVIPVTILCFIAALWRKLWLRGGVKVDGWDRGKFGIRKVKDLVVITALPYCFLILDVLIRKKVKHGGENLVLSQFFSFLSSSLGAVVIMIALLPVASNPGGAQVLQLLHRTCIIVLTITVHIKTAECVREDMILVCMQELVTVLVWFTIPFRNCVATEKYSGGDGGALSPVVEVVEEEPDEKRHMEVEEEQEEDKRRMDVEEEKEKKNKNIETEEEEQKEKRVMEAEEKEEDRTFYKQVSLRMATKMMNIMTRYKIIITTVIYMVLTYVISPAPGNEGITRAFRVCSFSGCLNYFSMRMLQQWPRNAPVSSVPVKLFEVFAKICFSAAAAVLVAVIPVRRGDFMTSLLVSPDQTILSRVHLFEFDLLSAKRRFLRSIAVEGTLFYLMWRLKINAERMEQPESNISYVRAKLLEVFANTCSAVAGAVLAVVISADFTLDSPNQTFLSSVRLVDFDFLPSMRRFLTCIGLEVILVYLTWSPKANERRMKVKAPVQRDHWKFKLE